MDCLECKKLEEAFEPRLSKYIEARSAAYYRVSTELAAKKNVDMERAFLLRAELRSLVGLDRLRMLGSNER